MACLPVAFLGHGHHSWPRCYGRRTCSGASDVSSVHSHWLLLPYCPTDCHRLTPRSATLHIHTVDTSAALHTAVADSGITQKVLHRLLSCDVTPLDSTSINSPIPPSPQRHLQSLFHHSLLLYCWRRLQYLLKSFPPFPIYFLWTRWRKPPIYTHGRKYLDKAVRNLHIICLDKKRIRMLILYL